MLADWIVDVITSNVPRGAVVADPMCGTAAVSEALAIGGFRSLPPMPSASRQSMLPQGS